MPIAKRVMAIAEQRDATTIANSQFRKRPVLDLRRGTEPAKLLASLVGAGAEVSHFETVLAPMEEVFRQVVRKAAA